jgi:hypothetical protein
VKLQAQQRALEPKADRRHQNQEKKRRKSNDATIIPITQEIQRYVYVYIYTYLGICKFNCTYVCVYICTFTIVFINIHIWNDATIRPITHIKGFPLDYRLLLLLMLSSLSTVSLLLLSSLSP